MNLTRNNSTKRSFVKRTCRRRGAALIELTIALPFMLMLIWLLFAFLMYAKNYSMASQTSRQGAAEGAMYYNVANLALGSGSKNTMTTNREDDYCGGINQCQKTCSYLDPNHNNLCAHWVSQARARQFIDVYNFPISEARITTEVENVDNDVIFTTKITGEYQSEFQVFGHKKLAFSSKAFVRALNPVVTPSPTASPTYSPSANPTPTQSEGEPEPSRNEEPDY